MGFITVRSENFTDSEYGGTGVDLARLGVRGTGMTGTDVPTSGGQAVDLREAELPMPGELIYEYTPLVTHIVEYGISADAMFAGEMPPPEGARLDLTLEGPIGGPKLNGTVKGKDYICFRADGKAQLHIHAEITTDDGKKISLFADGVAIGQQGSPVFRLRENVTLTTSELDFAWLNSLQIWGVGTVDVSTGQVELKGYATTSQPPMTKNTSRTLSDGCRSPLTQDRPRGVEQ